MASTNKLEWLSDEKVLDFLF